MPGLKQEGIARSSAGPVLSKTHSPHTSQGVQRAQFDNSQQSQGIWEKKVSNTGSDLGFITDLRTVLVIFISLFNRNNCPHISGKIKKPSS